VSRRSRRRSSMRADYGTTGGPWLSGWGNDLRLGRRIERARRKRQTLRMIRELGQ
jgi:hypothetical protein